MVTKTARRRVTFAIESEPGKIVSVAGAFNNWDTEKKILKDKEKNGIYKCTMLIEPGTYEYKFFIDGTWYIDPINPNFSPNNIGTLNSVLIVE
jgi:1,4-alpha-glucan branching enzyme